jgi:hypothetical protein
MSPTLNRCAEFNPDDSLNANVAFPAIKPLCAHDLRGPPRSELSRAQRVGLARGKRGASRHKEQFDKIATAKNPFQTRIYATHACPLTLTRRR